MSRNKASPNALPDPLKFFDSLPESAHVRLPVVQALYGCSPATVWRRVKSGEMPKPRKFSSRVSCWNVGELRVALSAGSSIPLVTA